MILQQHKIVFAGTMGAGKTEAIRSLSDVPILQTEAFNTDQSTHQKLQTTVGIDYGEIVLENGTTVGLYGTPGQSRFDFLWPLICKGAVGAVILIDHSCADPIAELENYIQTFQEYTNHIAIGITHADCNPNRSTHIYYDWLQQNNLFNPLFMIDARKKEDILLLIEALLTSIEINFNIAHSS